MTNAPQGNSLEGKTALVTGSIRGIGRAIALKFARQGASIVINGPPAEPGSKLAEDAEETRQLVEQLGVPALVYLADVGNRQQQESMFEACVQTFGRLDIAVANAGFNRKERIVETEVETAAQIVDVNLWGVFHTCQLAAQQMIRQFDSGIEGGRILVTGSIHADMAIASHGVYAMCKIATMHMTRILAIELAKYKINVNSVNPGWTDTENERTFISDEQLMEAAEQLPLKRLALPEEIADAFSFLASDEASYISGNAIAVDGALRWNPRSVTKGLDDE